MRWRTPPLWGLFAGTGVLCAAIFATTDRLWVQATVQVLVYVAAAFLVVRNGWRRRHAGDERIYVLMSCAFLLYFGGSIAGTVIEFLPMESLRSRP